MMPIADLPGRAVLELTGEDRVGFLQGLVSNDVTEASAARAVWAALLTPQGKWLADFFITAGDGRLLLDVEADQAAMVSQRLGRFRLRSKVTIQPTGLVVQAGWDCPAPDGATPDPRHPEAGWRLLASPSCRATAAIEDWDLHRLRLGLPDGSRDLEAEKTTLLEANFDELNGISWTKGCYMGQELTARTKYRGLLKRRLVPIAVHGSLPPPGTPILANGIEVGTMRSGRGTLGLALLRNDAIASEALDAAGTPLWAMPPRWMQLAPIRLAGAPV